jgi:hypothetical protein
VYVVAEDDPTNISASEPHKRNEDELELAVTPNTG